MKDDPSFASLLLCYNTVLTCVVLGSVVALSQTEERPAELPPDDVLREIIDSYIDKYNLSALLPKRHQDSDIVHAKKRRMVKYDRQRAFDAVMSDWMNPTPRFDDKQFERTFRMKRWMVDYIISTLAKTDSFWIQTRDAVGRLSISPVVKLLTALKMLCFGVSFTAFKDYFQMGESTARFCLHELCTGLVKCPELSEKYLRLPSKSDARRIVQKHKDVHGIDGMLGSLDVTKIKWEKCPQAWKGQFVGKEGYATIGLEAVADYDLWIWHSAFGFPGSLNDINIWDRSTLFQSMLDGSHSMIDFPFKINGEDFNQLYYLVDGIYPWLKRFLCTIPDPVTTVDRLLSKSQESWRKSIERAFGVWKKSTLW